jgi:MFS family permease
MRIGYGLVVVSFLVAAFLRLRLQETMKNVSSKPSLSELVRSYPTALRESFAVWKKLPSTAFYLFVAGVIGNFGFAAVQLYFVAYAVRDVLHIDGAVWPLILTALFVTMIIMAVPMGKLVDKVNRKIPMLIAFMLFGVAMLLFIYGDVPRLFLSLMLVGVGQAMLNAAFSALQADMTPREQRGKVVGFTNFANNILMASGGLIGGFVYEHLSPQMPFFIALAVTVPQFLITLFFVHEPKQREE